MPVAVKIEELTRVYNTHIAVDHISLKIEPGEILGLLGPNGAGKSTTIKMLTTLLPPTSGTAKIYGFDIIQEPNKVRKEIGYVPQAISADGDLTGIENMRLSGKLYGLAKQERENRIEELLHFMGLEEFANNQVSNYSGGMIRRLEIAQALLHKPNVLFLDEPTVGLDPSARRVIWKRIEELRRSLGTTIFMSTHDMDEADQLCDMIAFMNNGRILVLDTPQNLKHTVGPHASLDDVFLYYTGNILEEGGDYDHAQQIRRTISHLD